MKKITDYLVLFASVSFFVLWILFDSFNILIWSILLFNIHNILFSLNYLENRIYFLFFNMTVFLFLLSRPVIDMFTGVEWINYNYTNATFALISIGCSLLFLLIGTIVSEKIINSNDNKKIQYERKSELLIIEHLRFVSLIIYYIAIISNFIVGVEKIMFIQSSTYSDYYISYNSQLPSIITLINSMVPAIFSLYLATMPSKKKCIIPIALYIISTIPDLIVGARGPISEALIFIFIYFFLRDNKNYKKIQSSNSIKEIWITKSLKALIVILLPVIFITFSSYDYIRFGTKKDNDMNPIVNFVYGQGVSFTTITRGYDSIPYLPNYEEKNYTFGPFIDYIKAGKPSQIIFGAEPIPSTNSEERATRGNNFSDALSYYLYRSSYLQGRGTGSSYIIEVYSDFGFIGIIVFSLFLAILFSVMNNNFSISWFKNLIILRILMDIFTIPRNPALSWLKFLIAPQFWVPIIICYLGAKILMYKKILF